jgi:hypothetical protein
VPTRLSWLAENHSQPERIILSAQLDAAAICLARTPRIPTDLSSLRFNESGVLRESLPLIPDVGTDHYLKDVEVTKPRMKYLGISVADWNVKQFT